jgi:two-component system CheB/CheR fusion protein
MGTVAARRSIVTKPMSKSYQTGDETPRDDLSCPWEDALLESMTEAVLVVDECGEVLRTNSAYQQLFGTALSLGGATDGAGNLLPLDSMPRQRATSDGPFSMEFSLTEADGARRWFEARGRPIRDRQGRPRGGVVTFRDVTERSLHRLQNEFVARVSHELGAPLSALILSLRMILGRLSGDLPDSLAEELRDYAEAALWEGERMRVVVGDLMDMSRLQRGKLTLRLQAEDLTCLVRRAVAMAQLGTRSQTFALDVPNRPVEIKGDATRLDQIVVNLLSNAMQHAPLSARVDVRLCCADGRAELQVRDYGPGIRADALATLFSRFHGSGAQLLPPTDSGVHSNSTGLGLGLFITKELVDAHQGAISVESQEGRGATFTVYLPLLDSGDQVDVCTVAFVPAPTAPP